jgi:hypothetical protein
VELLRKRLEMQQSIKLGNQVKDVVSGFKGIVVALIEYINGCDQCCVQPPVDKEGKIPDAQYFDYKRLKIIGKSIQLPMEDTGGPQRDVPRSR